MNATRKSFITTLCNKWKKLTVILHFTVTCHTAVVCHPRNMCWVGNNTSIHPQTCAKHEQITPLFISFLPSIHWHRVCLLTCLCCPQAKFPEGFQHKGCLLSALPSTHSACFPCVAAQRARSALCRWPGEAPREPATERPARRTNP